MPSKNNNPKSYNEELYVKKPINSLILFGIYSVATKKEQCAFERLVKECFALFPKAFSFSRYKEWPDSRKLDRPLRFLRRKKLISGDPKNYFSLTKLGNQIAGDIAEALKQTRLKI